MGHFQDAALEAIPFNERGISFQLVNLERSFAIACTRY